MLSQPLKPNIVNAQITVTSAVAQIYVIKSRLLTRERKDRVPTDSNLE